MDDRDAEGGNNCQTERCNTQHTSSAPPTGPRERGNDTGRSTGRSGRQNAATRRNMRRDERVTVQGPVKEQQLHGMSHTLQPTAPPPPTPSSRPPPPTAPPTPSFDR